MEEHYLIRGCWKSSGHSRGNLWDIDAEEDVAIELIGWAPLPADEERRRMTGGPVGLV